jgi:hypothetical protein
VIVGTINIVSGLGIVSMGISVTDAKDIHDPKLQGSDS